MNRTILNTAAAALVALTVGLASAPAFAGGQLSVTVIPTDPEHAQAMGMGLQMYSLLKGLENGSITQNGNANIAGILQNGGGNNAIVHQEGDGHNGTIQQNGNGNSYGLFQFGEGTNGHVAQNGNGQTGATFQFGW